MNTKYSPEFTKLVKASDLYQNFVNAISAPEVTHVSFDVFDTLLRRECNEPKQIFAKVIEHLPADIAADFSLEAPDYQQMRIAAERLARQASSSEEINFDDIFKQMALPQAHINALKQQEIELELAQSFADPFCALLLEAVQRLGKQVVFISDMYLPYAIIQRLIDNACELNDYRLFVSCDFGQTKYTGQLFVSVLSELAINVKELVHIGDHATSDLRSPQIMGINSFLFNTDSVFDDILLREKHYQVDLPPKVKLSRTLASILAPQYQNDEQQFFYQVGARLLGPILTQMSQWIVADCQRLKIDTLLAMMREGKIFNECIRRHINWQSITDIESVNFYASRKSTYLPSMIAADITETLANTLSRKSYTLGDLIAEFGITAPELKSLLSLPVSSLNKVDVAGQNGLSLVNQVFSKASFEVTAHIRKHHQLFIEYLNQAIGNHETDKCFASLDLGAGATIAQQMVKASEKQAKVNYLLFSSERGYGKANEIAIKAFLPFVEKTQKAISILQRSPEVIEYFLVGETGTTLGYHRQQGKVQPVCEKRNLSDAERLNYQAFREGVKSFQIVAQSLNLAPADHRERVSYAQILCRLIDCPTSDEVGVIGQCQHEDSFGSQVKYSVIKEENVAKVEDKGLNHFYQQFCEQFTALKREMPWPQGVITHLSPNYLSTIARVNAQEHAHLSAVKVLIGILTADGINKIIVYGAGDFFLYLYDFLVENKIKVYGLVDRRAEFVNFSVNDIPVYSLHQCDFSQCNTIVVASGSFVDEIKQDLARVIKLDEFKVISI